MSVTTRRGSNIPVEDFSPKIKAKMTTTKIPIPLIPDFEMPMTKAENNTNSHCVLDN